MNKINRLAAVLLTCGVSWAQTGSWGSVSAGWGFTIAYESKTEPQKPYLAFPHSSGLKSFGEKQPGMKRYFANKKTHEYFGYDAKVDTIDAHAGTYLITFSPLTLGPEDMYLPDPTIWRALPPPVFPSPQVVNIGDTVALDLFENPATGQKIVDYIRIKRDSCDTESGSSQVSCMTGLVQDARQTLGDKLKYMEGKLDASVANSIRSSQQAWEKYRDETCASQISEVKRLECELQLSRSRAHDLKIFY